MQDVGATLGVQNSVFPALVGGDKDRAAYFFLGSTTPGASGRGTDRSFPGTWFGFIATTYDGGATWGQAETAGEVATIAPATYHIDTAFAGDAAGRLLASTDRGRTWEILKQDLPPIQSVAAARLV